MANRRPQNNGRRPDFQRNDRPKSFGRSGVSPWQGAGPGGGLPNLLPLAGGSTEATLALASNLINLLQPRQNPVPSLLDMPIRRDFGPNVGRFDRGFSNNRMGNQNFRRTGNYNRAGERINSNRKPFWPNDGQRQQNRTPKKEADSKAKPVKESDEKKEENDQDKEGSENKKDVPKTRYDDINPALLKCHICNKSMWDGRSFENHLSGRAHAIMMQKTAESYALTADTMRQEFKIREMKRTRKSGQQPARDFYCAMCDMYAADGANHRTTVGHRKLKKYLHPTCTGCHKEMPTRIELDEHRLTTEHLRNMQDKQETISKPKPEVMVISTHSMELSYVREDRQRRRRDRDRDARKDNDNANDEEPQIKREPGTEDEPAGEREREREGSAEGEHGDRADTVLDYQEGDDLTGVTAERFPAYNTERGVGASFLAPFRCVQCHLCKKLLEDDATAAVHLRTWRHHQLFTKMLAEKAGQDNKPATETPTDSGKRPLISEESGNWKRRKTTPDGDDNGDQADDQADDQGDQGDDQGDDALEESLAAGSGEGGSALPAADELEDWDQDESMRETDDQDNGELPAEEDESAPALDPEPEPEPEEAPAPAPAPTRARGTPRGRARGRGGRRY